MVIRGGLPSKEHPDISFSNYGLGWFLANYRGHYRVEHGGNIDGFSTSTSFFPIDSIGIFVSVNQNGSGVPSIIRNTIADRMLKLAPFNWQQEQKDAADKAKAAEKELQKSDSTNRKYGTKPTHSITDYIGTFKNEAYGKITISLDKDSLKANFNGLHFKLQHYHYNYFSFIPVHEGIDATENDAIKGQFTINLKGDIQSLKLPFEASVKDIEFVKEVQAIEVSNKELQVFTGDYLLPGPTVVKVYIRNEKTLMVLVPGQPDYELVPVKENLFNFKIISGYSVRFDKDEKGEVTALSFIQPNGTFKANRKK
jgi:hypothetical protein